LTAPRPGAEPPVQPATTRGFLFADLRDYTRYAETHGDEAAAELLAAYRAIMREVLGRVGGAEIRTEGDSFYVVFTSASTAVQGGLAILAAAAEASAERPGRPIRVGVGVHAGETAELVEGPVGTAVNIAARVCSQARAGELLVTDTVRSLTRTRLPVRFVARGTRRLKGITEPIALFAVEAAGATAGDAACGPVRDGRRRLLIPAGVVVVVLAAAGAIVLVGSRTPGSSPTPGSSFAGAAGTRGAAACESTSGASATLPPVADVPFYRADIQRDSVYPGPGPVCQPVIAWQQPLGSGADFAPIVADGKVVVGDQEGLHAFDARTGAPAWTVAGKGAFVGSAAADNGIVFAADLGDTLHAVDVHTGTERWTIPLSNGGISPVVAQGLLWVGAADGHAYGLDPATGKPRWTWVGPSGVQTAVNLVSADTAYITAGGLLYAVRLVDQSEVWPFDGHGTAMTTPVLAGNTIYVGTKGSGQDTVFALDRATGTNRWSPPFSTASGRDVNPGPFLQGVLYVSTSDDGVYAIEDKGTSYQVVWHSTDVTGVGGPASLVGQTLYVQQSEGELFALHATDGTTLWKTSAKAMASRSPVVTGGIVYQVDYEESVLRAWAEPGLVALLGAPSSPPSASPGPPVPDPFTVTATYPWFQTGIQVPAAMAIGPDGLLYVLHANGNGRESQSSRPTVTVIDPKTGQPIRSWGQYGSGPGQLDLSSTDDNSAWGCILVAADGLVYVGEEGNHRVQVFKSDGTPVRQIGAGTLGKVQYCVLGPDDSLYTVNTWESIDGVQDGPRSYQMSKFSPSGKLRWQNYPDPGHPSVADGQVGGIALLSDGHLLGFDLQGGLLIDPTTGRVVGPWGSEWNADAGGPDEAFMSLDGAGNVYLFNVVPHRLRVFDPLGRLIGGVNGTYGELFCGGVYWPPPVFDTAGFGYSFDCDGLVQLKVTLPPP
jgi:eukaryotic-like serine/threonine-protein kinase